MGFRWVTPHGVARCSKCSDVDVTYHVATAADEADIRRLLRENPIGGRYVMSLEREPNGLAGTGLPEERKTIILARDGRTGVAVGLCERITRPAFFKGKRCLLPYLGALRIAASHRHRIAILKGGFRAVHEHAMQSDEVPFALTSIAADNTRARILTAGIKGLPRYTRISEYKTLVLLPRRGRVDGRIRRTSDGDMPRIAAFLQAELSRYQFAPVWDEVALQLIGSAQILVYQTNDAVEGCVAVWNQSSFKQTVARGYPPLIAVTRPLINAIAPLTGKPRLPAIGQSLPLVYLSAFAASSHRPEAAIALVGAARDLAAQRGAGAAVLGMDSRHPCGHVIRKTFPAIEYRTELFCVDINGCGEVPVYPGNRLTMPDVGLM